MGENNNQCIHLFEVLATTMVMVKLISHNWFTHRHRHMAYFNNVKLSVAILFVHPSVRPSLHHRLSLCKINGETAMLKFSNHLN